jgi:DNA-binding NarL/FixJ family response regulator
MDKIKVLLADDHPLILEGLKKILDLEADIEVMGLACNGLEAVQMVERYRPHVVLLDINMPGYDGVKACTEIKEKVPETKVIALTVCEEEEKVVQILKAGAKGYFLKDVNPDKLLDAVRNVVKGQSFIHPKIADKVINQLTDIMKSGDVEKKHPLTIREIEVIKLIAEGLTNKEIAQKLFISEKTVKNHITNILRKLGLRDRTQAALWAIKKKVV